MSSNDNTMIKDFLIEAGLFEATEQKPVEDVFQEDQKQEDTAMSELIIDPKLKAELSTLISADPTNLLLKVQRTIQSMTPQYKDKLADLYSMATNIILTSNGISPEAFKTDVDKVTEIIKNFRNTRQAEIVKVHDTELTNAATELKAVTSKLTILKAQYADLMTQSKELTQVVEQSPTNKSAALTTLKDTVDSTLIEFNQILTQIKF